MRIESQDVRSSLEFGVNHRFRGSHLDECILHEVRDIFDNGCYRSSDSLLTNVILLGERVFRWFRCIVRRQCGFIELNFILG
jgi:hypothetical protein